MSQSGQPEWVAPTFSISIVTVAETQSERAMHSNAIFFVNLSSQFGMGQHA